ncbi:MAG: DNA cytosine methyltransferase [Saprospiraceae bacterium]|nr:DNA cytosine methyltransferase [Candidatus Vicinibacter affinis]
MKVLDTFAGAGGFSLGFHLTGQYDVIGAIEYDQWAADTFKFNHPESTVLVGDIQQYDEKFLLNTFKDKPDIILGGPPCQGYSIANRKAGDPADPRNSLFKEFIRLGKIFDPKIMIMENVPNLIKAKTKDNELVIDIIIQELKNLGYNVYHTILSATDFGVPQIRKRLVVIASKEPLEKNDFQKYLRGKSKKAYNHVAMKHSKRMVERFESMSCGDSISDVPEHLRPIKRNGNGEFSEKLYDQNNRKMHPDRPCHTIAASFYANFVHPFKNRNFTPREGARIQTFPDWYVFKGKPTVVSHKLLQREGREEEKHLCQYNQIGNAVPPFLARAIAENLFSQLSIKSQKECLFTETI